MNFLSGISLKVWGYLAALFAVLGTLWKVYSAGKDAARVEGLKDELRDVETHNAIENDVERASEPELTERLRKWRRD